MEIKRITKEGIKQNKKENKDVFNSIDTTVDTIELDESLFTHYYAKYTGAIGEVFATDDIVKVEFEHDVNIIERTITLDGTRYVFYLASASDLKKSSAIFIKESLVNTLGKELIKHTTGDIVNRLEGMDVVINKIQAYISFMFSGAIKTSIDPKVVVIEELQYKYTGLHTVLKDINTLEFNEEVIETTLGSHDGQGIISLELAEKIRQELNSKRSNNKALDYINWITFRLFTIGGKGMCITVDIKDQLEKVWMQFGDSVGLKKVNETLYVKDIYNEWHDVDSIDMILNESQTKLIKYFNSNEDINKAKEQVPKHLKDIVNSLYICKHNENKLKIDRTKLNYQFTQALALTPSEIIQLTKNDRELLEQALKDIDSMLLVNGLAEMKDSVYDEEVATNTFNLSLDLVKYDESFLKDKTVLEQIRRLYISKIKSLSYARVFINDMAYRLVVQDPQVYMNFIATRDMVTARSADCLQAGEYQVVGKPQDQKIIIGRNPLSSHQEMIKFKNIDNEYINSLGYKCDSLIIFNSYDATPSRMSGMDFDGDTCAVIVDDIIYNSVIELDTPLFFNTFDGYTVKDKYTKDNIISITKVTAGDKIGSLALSNAGLMSKCNEIPYYDSRYNKLISLEELYEKEKQSIIDDAVIEDNIVKNIWNNIEQLIQQGIVQDGIYSMTDEEMKKHIQEQHKKYRYEQYLILLAQQMAIDCSKTGVDIPKHIQQEIKKLSERPYFLWLTKDGRRYDKFRNTVLDVYARNTFHQFNSKRIELLDGIKVAVGTDVTEDKTFKNTNAIRNLFKRASEGANQDKVDILLKYIRPKVDTYNKNRQGLRHYKEDVEYYKTSHNKLSNEMRKFFDVYYTNCKNGVNNFTLEDLTKAIYELNMPSKYILEFLSELLIYNLVKVNDKKKVFLKGDLNNGSKVITLGRKKFTVEYEKIKIGEVESKVVAHSLQLMKKRQLHQGTLLEMKATYGIDFELEKEYILKRKESNRFLFQLIDQDGVIIDEVRLSQGSKEFQENIDVLKVVIESHKATSKTKKYDTWYIERCA